MHSDIISLASSLLQLGFILGRQIPKANPFRLSSLIFLRVSDKASSFPPSKEDPRDVWVGPLTVILP